MLRRWFRGYEILSLDQTAGVVSGGDVLEHDVTRQRAEEGNTIADEHRNPGNDQALDETGPKKPLDGDPAVHVDVVDAS